MKAANEVVMAFQVIRTDETGQVPFVNQTAARSGTNRFNQNNQLDCGAR